MQKVIIINANLALVEILLQNTALLVLSVVVLVSLILQTLHFFGILSAFGKKVEENTQQPISMVMAVKNEEEIIVENVRKWLKVLPIESDMVIADDQSWDGTPEILEKIETINKQLHCIYLREDAVKLSGKKFALTLAIKGAKHDAMLLSDADCYPADDACLPLFAQKFSEGYTMVLGHSPLVGSAGLPGTIQKLEGFGNALSFTGYTSLGVFYMGIGRAMGYSKSAFLTLGGFKSLYKLPYGDDDLFVQQFSSHFKKTLLLHPKAFVETKVIEGMMAYINQKRRHLSAGRKYKFLHKIMLMLLPFSHVASLVALVLVLLQFGFNSNPSHFALAAFGLKTLLELIYNVVLSKKLAYGSIGLGYMLWQYISPLFNAIMVISLWIKPVKIWSK